MLKILTINDSQFKYLTKRTFECKTAESTVHPFTENENKKVFKLFKEKKFTDDEIDNKVKKITILNEKLENANYVVKAENIIKYRDKIIGYTMPYINGDTFSTLSFNKRNSKLILKEIANKLKELHKLNIICADIPGNILVDKEKNITFIDYDNFAVDNLKIDTRNMFLRDYLSKIDKFDEKFDYYLFNLYTLAILSKIHIIYINTAYQIEPYKFDLRNKEINKIVYNTFDLLMYNRNQIKTYDEDLIIDKLMDTNKKIKFKKF